MSQALQDGFHLQQQPQAPVQTAGPHPPHGQHAAPSPAAEAYQQPHHQPEPFSQHAQQQQQADLDVDVSDPLGEEGTGMDGKPATASGGGRNSAGEDVAAAALVNLVQVSSVRDAPKAYIRDSVCLVGTLPMVLQCTTQAASQPANSIPCPHWGTANKHCCRQGSPVSAGKPLLAPCLTSLVSSRCPCGVC